MAGEMLACVGLRRRPITSARPGSLATQPAPIECKIDSGMQEKAVLCAQSVTRLLASALQHRLSKASCNRHDYAAIIRRRITTSSASENQKHPQRAQASRTFLQSIRFASITSKSTTLCAVVPKHERQQENKSPPKIDTRAVHVTHFQSSSSKLHHSPTFS